MQKTGRAAQSFSLLSDFYSLVCWPAAHMCLTRWILSKDYDPVPTVLNASIVAKHIQGTVTGEGQEFTGPPVTTGGSEVA